MTGFFVIIVNESKANLTEERDLGVRPSDESLSSTADRESGLLLKFKNLKALGSILHCEPFDRIANLKWSMCTYKLKEEMFSNEPNPLS